jgi:hypothetical protein
MSVLNLYPTVRPTLSFDFVNAGVLDPSVTFTRPTSATYFDETGILRVANPNTPRFDFNPSTLAAQGFLIEESRTNLCLQSADFSTTWSATNVTVTTNAVVSPDGTTNADNVFETVANAEHFVRQNFTGLTANSVYTITVFVKNLGGRNLRIRVLDTDNVANGYQMTVSPSLGTVVLAAATVGAGSSVTGTISTINNGWYRVTLSGNAGATCTKYTLDFFSVDGTTFSFVGDVTKGLTLFGAQLEAGAFPTSYIPTTTTALTRSADVASVNTLSPWYNAVEYTLYYEGMVQANSDGVVYVGIGDTFDNTAYMTRVAPDQYNAVRSGGANQAQVAVSFTPTAGTAFKQAITVKVNDFAFCVNGGAVATDTSGAVPLTAVRLGIGNSPWTALGGNQRQQWIRRITYYPVRLTNAQLQNLTA